MTIVAYVAVPLVTKSRSSSTPLLKHTPAQAVGRHSSLSVSPHGRKSVNTLPGRRADAEERTFSTPPCRFTISSLIHNPSPVPLISFVVKNGSNILDCVSGDIPRNPCRRR